MQLTKIDFTLYRKYPTGYASYRKEKDEYMDGLKKPGNVLEPSAPAPRVPNSPVIVQEPNASKGRLGGRGRIGGL